MTPIQVVIDTNVMVSAARSKRGASHLLVGMIGDPRFQVNVSCALLLEYEAKLKQEMRRQGRADLWRVDRFLDALAACSNQRSIFFSFRSEQTEADDAFIVDLAIASGAMCVITYNCRHFAGLWRYGKKAIRPMQFLKLLEAVS